MKMILIGGGNIGRGKSQYETKKIDTHIVRITRKEHPDFLFIGLASNYADSYYDTIKKNYQSLGCKTNYLKKSNLINNPQLVKEKIEKADIIYIGGGDTVKLMDEIKKYSLKELLYNAYSRDCVMVGYSAGAISLSDKGISDSYILRGESKDYSLISGMGFNEFIISPHFQDDKRKRELLKILKSGTHKIIGIEDSTALEINNNNISAIHDKNGANVHLLTYKDGVLIKDIIL